ncbi:butyrophilin-like protein 2 isoform X5 [Oncorhynchus keta]|nr:butyrophilin-like protein 2 isoform X4 [Oncorhynchus keta]XP_052377384.1 butyrophilin-like protein 2 isoform X5 [Oncorhynchus keta]
MERSQYILVEDVKTCKGMERSQYILVEDVKTCKGMERSQYILVEDVKTCKGKMSRVKNDFKLTTADDSERVGRGHDVTLHCHLSPKTSAVVMTIRWFKGTECIYLYNNGQVTESVGYEGRVSLMTPELEGGNVSLRLRDFRRSDVGRYRCQVVHGEQKEEAAVSLEVASGSRLDFARLYGAAFGQVSEVAQPEPGLKPDSTSLQGPENSCATTLPIQPDRA